MSTLGHGVPEEASGAERLVPGIAPIEQELSRFGVTWLLLWQEYRGQHPNGLQHSASCDQCRAFLRTGESVERFASRLTDASSTTTTAKPPQ